MQTSLLPSIAATVRGQQAESILRKCVHCGFCNATCPTYQLLGDELDGPRGRIYLIKQLLEGVPANSKIELHLDRCLTCRACETTCPSGVEYGKLLEIGRDELDRESKRNSLRTIIRKVVSTVVSSARMFSLSLSAGRLFRNFLPRDLKSKVPPKSNSLKDSWPKSNHQRSYVVLAGCVQGALTPNTNLSAALVLDKLSISLNEVASAGCCGSVDLHTTNSDRAKHHARKLIDAWWPFYEQSEGFVTTASGCGLTISEYSNLFQNDAEYLEKAMAISDKVFDISEVVAKEFSDDIVSRFVITKPQRKVAFHSPCTLQHGQKISGVIEKILRSVGYKLCDVRDAHLCCGSAGTYSLLQPKISSQLGRNKLAALTENQPDVICTANVGCQNQLQINNSIPVVHWIELLL